MSGACAPYTPGPCAAYAERKRSTDAQAVR